ncbi:MAG TPA: serine--tRNA ligase [Phycisphaerales bacterium]|nr:serine--tRNA ligase [Phycisphaerales bacterium]
MIDLKDLRENPDRYRDGAAKKQIPADIDRVLELDAQRRAVMAEQEALRSEQKKLAKETGPKIGQLMGRLKKAEGEEKARLEAEIEQIKAAPASLKAKIQALDEQIASLTPRLEALLLAIPLPPDDDVPVGESADDNVELRRWAPEGWDFGKSFEENRGFAPCTHIELCDRLGLVDFPRGVKIAGSRSYVLTGDGMRLHQAVLRYALDFMADRNGFKPMSVPVLVREEAMVGTGFFPAGRDQAYHIEETRRGSGHDLFLTGTGEVGLMGLHQGEILDEADLPLRYVTVSTCFRREAGAAGKDTAGLYRIHQFDKVEQVVICRADEAESRAWHQKMIGYVEAFLQSLGLPYRLLQCCTADLGPKNADMIDIECWMPGRSAPAGTSALRAESSETSGTSALRAESSETSGTSALRAESSDTPELGSENRGTLGAFGETHSASRLYDFQCRRLNMRYRPGGETGRGPTTFCHSLNNTVAASPRILIPLLEMHQNEDGTVTIPEPLRPYMNNRERIG